MTFIRKLRGVIWNDIDGDALIDDGAFIDGVKVRLYQDKNGNGLLDSDDLLVATRTTNHQGQYEFSGNNLLKPGKYIVDVDDRSVNSKLPGATLTGGGPDPLSVQFNPLGPVISNANFGYQSRGSVKGLVFNDLDGNGVQNGEERGLAYVQVQLKQTDGTVIKTVTTNAHGNYTFARVPVGNYTVDIVDSSLQTQLPGAVQTAGVDPSAVTVVGGKRVNAGIDGYQVAPAPQLSVELGYRGFSEIPELNAVLSRRSLVDDLDEAIAIEAQQAAANPEDFDGQLDGYRYYIQPKDGTTFTQTIRINNTAGGGTAQTVEFIVEATNSSYIRLLQSGFSATIRNASDNSVINNTPAFTVSSDLDPASNTQKYRITFNNVNLTANQYILLETTSEIDQQAFDGVNSNDIAERTATFNLEDGPGEDWGAGTASNNFYFSLQDQGGNDRFSFSDGIPDSVGNGLPGAYAFGEFSDSTLKVDLSPNTPGQLTDADVKWQSADTVSGLGTYAGVDTLGGNGAERSKTTFYKTISGNLDSIVRASSDSRSGSLLPSELLLTWFNPPAYDPVIEDYIAAQAAGNEEEAYAILLNDLIDKGLFDQEYARDSIIFKQDGRLVEGFFTRTNLDGTPEFTQEAIAGELIGTNPATNLLFGKRGNTLTMQVLQDGVLIGQASGSQNGIAPSVAPFSLFAIDSPDAGSNSTFVDRTWFDQGEAIGIADGEDGNTAKRKRIDGDEILGITVTGFEALDALINVDHISSTDGAAIKVRALDGTTLVKEQIFNLEIGNLGQRTLTFTNSGFFDTLQLSAADADTQFTFRSVELPLAFAI